jgi:hypothetical protein
MNENEVQAWRVGRLEAMIEREGGKAAAGRKLGYKDGAFVGQMLRGERPITEKTVAAAHALAGYSGWFDRPIKTKHTPALHEASGQDVGAPDLVIVQYEAGGAMGAGLMLEEQPPGHIKAWRVDQEWLRLNVRHHTGVNNLCIVTGFGPSMRPKFNPGDPLLMDRGVNRVDHEGIYFFRVGDQGFIKQLQRIPTESGLIIRVKSFNTDYDPWDITAKMDFEVFGKILTVWKSEQF